jgi:DNA-binding GntR family transcriptional regulator
MSSVWTPIEQTHLADRVYEQVRARILSRAIKGDEQINVDGVAAELCVSRTPVLEAIKRLSADGLVEIRSRRGSFVKGVTARDVTEIFQIREALELFAARFVIESEDSESVVQKMQVLLDEMQQVISNNDFKDYSRFTLADRAFHNTIVEACGNQRMKASYENLNVHLHIMRSHFFKRLDPPQRVHADHVAILDALRSKDARSAERVIKRHLSSIREKMIDNICGNGGTL